MFHPAVKYDSTGQFSFWQGHHYQKKKFVYVRIRDEDTKGVCWKIQLPIHTPACQRRAEVIADCSPAK